MTGGLRLGYGVMLSLGMDRTDDELLQQPGTGHATRKRYSVGFARGPAEVRAAQRLRWRVFAEELGARLPARVPGIDHDIFDSYCEHLVVSDDETGEVVGTYRILAPAAARRVGGYYSENEFDLTRLRLLRSRHIAPVEYRVFPRHCLPLDELDTARKADAPPLIRGYLSAGAWICGEPACDPDFNTADFFMFLPLARLNPRHARHFFGEVLRVG